MAKEHADLNEQLQEWIRRQHLYFVATAPLSAEGFINCSPKGLDTFAILDPQSVAYLDLTGSGAETIAHVRENGRIVVMFCSFEGPPKIVRLHGRGEVITPDAAEFAALRGYFPDVPGERSIIRVHLTRISDSCGFGVPQMDYAGDRDQMVDFAEKQGPVKLTDYQKKHNQRSLDGLPALTFD
jgi:hypothetical protein